MDRDLGTPKTSQESPSTCAGGTWASRFADETNPPRPARCTTPNAASSKAHDKDATFNKELYR
jgi:hypothetical protein